jgi:hypothetical protein
MPIIMDLDMIHAFSSQAAHEPFTNPIRLRRSIRLCWPHTHPSSFWNLEMTTAKDKVTDYTQPCLLGNITAVPFNCHANT